MAGARRSAEHEDESGIALDLTKVADARKFFRDLRTPDGKQVDGINFPNIGVVVVIALDDAQVCHYAQLTFQYWLQKGIGYLVETPVH